MGNELTKQRSYMSCHLIPAASRPWKGGGGSFWLMIMTPAWLHIKGAKAVGRVKGPQGKLM